MTLLSALVLSLAAAPALAPQQKPATAPSPPPTKVRPYNLDSRIDEIALADVNGKSVAVFAANPEKAIVLVFWSYRDPVSRGYVKALAELQAKHADKLAVYLVDSNHDELVINGDALAKIREVVKGEGITLPILIDEKNALADDFDAQNNAQAFAIDANHFMRYKGGIDDDPRGDKAKQGKAVKALLEPALDDMLRAAKPTEPWTMASGRPIRRMPKAAPAAEKPR